MMKNAWTAPLLALSILARSGLCRADEPMAAPAKEAHYSANRSYCAVADPEKNEIAVYENDSTGNPAKRLYSIKGWERAVYLADDGEHLVIGYAGLNLLPPDFTPDIVVLRFYEKDKVVKTWKISELVRKSKLQRTTTHWLWRQFEGFDSSGRFEVETLDGKKFFDAKTGAMVTPK